MAGPHPTEADFVEAYAHAWRSDPAQLMDFFAPDGSYTDVAMEATYSGREAVGRFHRWMLKFAHDSVIEFSNPVAAGGRFYLEWIWSGTFDWALRLPDGDMLAAAGG
jgi:SnoaL-like domain